MEKNVLRHLEMLNQLKLNDAQREGVLSFLAKREDELASFDAIDTSKAEPMVYVMPTALLLREDVEEMPFSREALQAQAPLTDEGFWCVPRVIE